MNSATQRRLAVVGAAAAALIAWSLLYGWPIWAIVDRSLAGVAGRTGLTLDTLRSVSVDRRIHRLLLISVSQTLCSTMIVVMLGAPIAWALARLEFAGRRLLSAVVMTPFVLPTLTVAGSMVGLAGGLPRSDGARLALIVAAHVTFNLGIFVRSVSASIAATPPDLERAALLLGRRPAGAVVSTTFASIRSEIVSAAIVVAVFCLTSFGVIVVLGGASVGTIEVEIWVLTTRSLDLGRAAVLAGIQLAVVGMLVAIYQRLAPTRTMRMIRMRDARRRALDRFDRGMVAMAALTIVTTCVVPLTGLIVRSFRGPGGWTLEHYAWVVTGEVPGITGRSVVSVLGYTVAAALVATSLAVSIAIPAAFLACHDGRIGRWAELFMTIPLGISAATLGFGFLVAFSGPVVDLRGNWLFVPLVQAAAGVPVVFRVVMTAGRGLDRSLLDAAAVGGARWSRRVREIVWPALRHSVGVAAGFGFAMAVGEFGATVFLSRQDQPTAAVVIGRLLGRPGDSNIGRALALSCVLGVLATVSVAAIDRKMADAPLM